MEKLIELFNEYNYFCAEGDVYDEWTEKDFKTMSKEKKYYIISKDYGFIKWLVQNDKIDKEFEDNKMLGDIFDSGYRFNDDYIEERLLCYLALSKEPISFLISIIK